MFPRFFPFVLASLLASSAAVSIHFGQTNKCVHVPSGFHGEFVKYTPVVIHDCNGAKGQRWEMNQGHTKVHLVGTSLCLGGALIAKNGESIIINNCSDDKWWWYYTNDNRLAMETGVLCMELEQGITSNGHKVQTWECTDNDVNQIWTLGP